MRRILILIMAATAASCSGDQSTGVIEPSIQSLTVRSPEAIRVSDTVRLEVSALDGLKNPVRNLPVSFNSSNNAVATVDALGLVEAMAEGTVTLSVSMGSVTAEKVLRVLPSLNCSIGRPDCLATAERYVLVRVNDRALPVRSPWGAGDWDYDSDAGTWQVTAADLTLFGDGYFAYITTHRAASGSIATGSFEGRFERLPGSIQFTMAGGATWFSAITATGLLEQWEDGQTLVFDRIR